MKRMLLILLVGLAMAGCKKFENSATGTIRFTNISPGGNDYEMFLDGASLGLVEADSSYDKTEVPTGTHDLKVSQHNGYLFSPTVRNGSVIVQPDQTVEFTFP